MDEHENEVVEYVEVDPREVNAKITLMYVDAFIGLTKNIAYHAQGAASDPYMNAVTTNALRLADLVTERAFADLSIDLSMEAKAVSEARQKALN